MNYPFRAILLTLFVALPSIARADVFEVFAKGSASQNYITSDENEVSATASTGLAIVLIPQIRIEGRVSYITTLQNKLVAASDPMILTLSSIKTTTLIYSVGLDLNILDDKNAFQPFIYVGVGYIDTLRSYYVQSNLNPANVVYVQEPEKMGVSGNVGAGFRIHIANSVALEIEAFAFGIDLKNPNPLINWESTVGIRLFI